MGGSSANRANGPNGLREKDLTLDLVRRVRSLLAPELHIILTRDEDRNLSLIRRAGIARDNDAALFLSLHFDGASDPRVDRTQAWVARNAPAATRRFAGLVANEVARAAGIAAALPAQRDLGVLLPQRLGSHTEACLIEIACLTNPAQAARLERDSYRQELAAALANAVRMQLNESAASALQSPAGVIDEALDNQQAMIYSPKAPRDSVKEIEDKRADDRAVWSYCPKGFQIDEPEALVYFHGNDNYVTASLSGGVIKPRPPSWAPKSLGKLNAGIVYGFDKTDGLLHQPIELLPEVGVGRTGKFWADEPAGKLVNAAALGDMIDNCLDRLSKLSKPSGSAKYLSKKIQTSDLKRLFVMGHSGGTVPLNKAASNTVVLNVVSDLVPFDRSFSEKTDPYFDFCKHWDAKGRLGNGEKSSRFISFYGPPSPDMGPMGSAAAKTGSTLFHKLITPVAKAGLGFTANMEPVRVPQRPGKDGSIPAISWPGTDVIYIDHHTDNPAVWKKDPSDPAGKKLILVKAEKPPSATNLDGIRDALKSNYKALFIFTNVAHDLIPLAFMPLILEYKRNP